MGKIYDKVLFRAILNHDSLGKTEYYENIAAQSREFVLAIPDQWVYARIMGTAYGYDPEKVREICIGYGWVSDVAIFDREHLKLDRMRELYPFNVYFVGTEYGQDYIKDVAFCRENKIEMVLIAPQRYIDAGYHDALEAALKDVPAAKKIVCYGTGCYFDIYMEKYGEKYRPDYAVDQNEGKWGTSKDGIPIYSVGRLYKEETEDVLVILCCKEYAAMRDELVIRDRFDYRTLLFSNDLAMIDEFCIALEEEKKYMAAASGILKRLMCEFDRVCRKYGLKYYIISGSLIGAVRHHGMIPWDDDIDVGMPRKDLEKLKQIAQNEWDGGEYLFVDYWDLGNDTFHDLMPRLYYMKEKLPTKIMDKSRGKMGRDLADRIILDIYPMDNASDSPGKHRFNMNRIKLVYNLLMGHRGNIDYQEYAKLPVKTVKLIRLINEIGRMIPFGLLVRWMNRAITAENRRKTNRYYMSSGPIYYVERTYHKKFFGEGVLMDFEGMKVRVPIDYDGVLKAQNYGDYMELPSYEMRKPSHYFNADISIW